MFDKTNGGLLVGQVYVSKPGNLPCKFIIHAVGPRWRGGQRGELEHLRQAVHCSLEEAIKRNLRSIAMPAISTGIFGFPIDLATPIILQVIGEFFQQHEGSSLKEVHIIDIDENVLSSFEKEMKVMSSEENPPSLALTGNSVHSRNSASDRIGKKLV